MKHGVYSTDVIQSPETDDARNEVDNLRAGLSKEDERLFTVTTVLTLFADDKEKFKKDRKTGNPDCEPEPDDDSVRLAARSRSLDLILLCLWLFASCRLTV